MIAVVTGGSGFIGRNLTRRLRTDGHEVRCLVRPGGGPTPDAVRRFVVEYDRPASLLACEALHDADVVFHLAGATRATAPTSFIAANVTPTRHLLGALTALRLYPRFVFVSSQAAAGPAASRDRPIDEDDLPRPVEPYGRSKLEAERIVASFSDRVPTGIVRPCAVYGPGDRDFLTLFRFAAMGVIVYPGTASHWMSLLHVDDAVQGLLDAASSPLAIGRCLFLAPEAPVRWRELGDAIASAIGRHVRHLDLATPLVRGAAAAGELIGRVTHRPTIANRSKAALSRYPYWVCSAERARALLGFAETRSLPDGVRDTYYWYRKHGWLRGSRATVPMS